MTFKPNVLVLLALVLGLVVGWFASHWIQPAPASRAAFTPIESAESAPTPAMKPAPPERDAQAAPALDFKALMEKWYAEEQLDCSPHSGTVTARVVDENGEALPGIKVFCRWYTSSGTERQPFLKSADDDRALYMEALVRYYLRSLKRTNNATRSQISDANGAVSFMGVPTGGVLLFIEHPELRLMGADNSEFVSALPGAETELRLTRPCNVTISVSCPAAPAGIAVDIYIDELRGRRAQLKCDLGQSAIIKLPPGTYSARAHCRDRRVQLMPCEFEIKLGQPELSVSLDIELMPRLWGEVRFSGSSPLRAQVIAIKARHGLNDEALLDPSLARERLADELYGGGRFSFQDPSPGEYLVALKVGEKILATTRHVASPESPEVILTASGPPAEECLVVSLYAPGSEPRDDPQFYWRGQQGSRFDRFVVWQESSTRYRLWVGPRLKDNKDYPGTLIVSLQRHGTAQVATRSLHDNVLVTFQRTLGAKITVKGVPDELKRQIFVSLKSALLAQVDPYGYQGHYVENSGYNAGALTFRTQGLQPGKYAVTVRFRELGDMADVSTEFEVTQDQQELVVSLPEYHEVTIDASKYMPQESAYMNAAGSRGTRTVSFDRSGMALVRWLPTGKYTLHCRIGDESKPFEIDVTASGTIKLP
ncbi:hypothetical protein PLCT2_00429 [Planctomycetaceae bacterium]|nr:hypothetical protein PLCT2_00429 [Planctomycetaceae bacterium]